MLDPKASFVSVQKVTKQICMYMYSVHVIFSLLAAVLP